MNASNAKDYLPLVQALAEGKVIQSRMFILNPWKDCAHPDFTMDPSSYRIKPEPREIWVNRYPDGSEFGRYASREEAARRVSGNGAVQVCWREVIE